MNFDYRENSNGSYGLFNNIIGDIYYSNVGAYTEALQKFVLPSNIENYSKDKIKILDVCYG